MKAGLNKLLLEQIVETSKSPIIIQDHLKEKHFTILDVGTTRTNFENPPIFEKGSTVTLVPGTGYPVKIKGAEYFVCSFDDVLVVH